MTIRYGFLSTHPPTRCGLAIFNVALAAQLSIGGTPGGVVRVVPALRHPMPGQKLLLEQIVVAAADAVVTMTNTAQDRLIAGYAVDRSEVTVIPHGTTEYTGTAARLARPHTQSLPWSAVATRYAVLADRLVAANSRTAAATA